MKKFCLFFILLMVFSAVSIAAPDEGWVQYEDNSYINTTAKNIAVNPSMKQISYYSKQTNLSEMYMNQPYDTIITLSIVDCSGIVKTKDVSIMYFNSDKLISSANLDKATAWKYHSPDSVYYQNLQTFCSANFKNKK